MGIYDRDYQRGGYYDQQPGINLGGPRAMVTNLVIVNAIVYLVQLLTGGENSWLTEHFSLHSDWYRRPWLAYQLLSYGFLHSPNDLWHILINMFVLWMFGREVEHRYGSREFLAFYLAAIILAGLVWTLAEAANPGAAAVSGASGGVAGMVILFAMNFPHRTVLFLFVIPMPMWLLAVLIVAMDVLGAVRRSGDVAFTAHLGGAAFGFLYYRWRWRLERWLPDRSWFQRLRTRPRLRVVDPDEADETERRLDEILKKIQDQGRESLTRSERRFLERASREYQKRRH